MRRPLALLAAVTLGLAPGDALAQEQPGAGATPQDPPAATPQPAPQDAPGAAPQPAPEATPQAQPSPPPPTTTLPGEEPPAQPGDRVSATELLIVAAAFAGLVLLAGLTVALARALAWEPPWAPRARHSVAEASWRASAMWAEFADWLRLGR
jgi:hypothetical protein